MTDKEIRSQLTNIPARLTEFVTRYLRDHDAEPTLAMLEWRVVCMQRGQVDRVILDAISPSVWTWAQMIVRDREEIPTIALLLHKLELVKLAGPINQGLARQYLMG